MKSLITLILVFTLTSCNLFYKSVFGIKDPKIETYHSVNRYVKSIDVDSSLVIFTKDSISHFELNKIFSGAPEIIIFNKQLEFIPYKGDSVNCNASVDVVLGRICSMDITAPAVNSSVDYQKFVNRLDDHNNVLSSFNRSDFDFIVFADFTKYIHGINKKHIPGWNKALKNHSGACKVRMIYVNLDYLNTWNISKNSLPVFRLSPDKK